jgi:hypothetical protein
MQSPEVFMSDYFRERTEQLKREIQDRMSFRAKFFTDDCVWDSRKDDLRRSECERVINVSDAGSKAEVITQPASPFPKFRYHLQTQLQSWLIKNVELECLVCGGTGRNGGCPACNGSGWLGFDEHMRQAEK